MRNTGSENAVQNVSQKRQQFERRQTAMTTDRVAWFRRRKSI
jgi:hypothetical protein